jgi:hypothetical protein
MSLTFFATDTDLAQVYQWLLDLPEMRLFEDYSRPDMPNRWFSTWEEVVSASDTMSMSLAAWSEQIGGRPRIEKIVFDHNTQHKLKALGRTALHSPALIKLGRNNDQNGCLADSTIACWTEKGARQRSIYPVEFLDEVDWARLRSTIGKVQRQITKISPAKMRCHPIMPDAFAQLTDGNIRLWNWGAECKSDSPLITVK